MAALDILTLFYTFSIANAFVALFLTAYVIAHRGKEKFFKVFIASKLFTTCLWILFALRGQIPGLYSIVLANVLVFFATFYEVYCISFADESYSKRHFTIANGLAGFFSLIFILIVSTSETTRLVYMSLSLALLHLVAGWYLLFTKSKTKVQFLIGIFYICVTVIYSARSFWALLVDKDFGIMTGGIIQSISYMIAFISYLWVIAFLLILKEKSDAKMKADNDELQRLNETKNRFFSIISHDLRGPLANLNQLGMILSLDTVDEKEKKRLIELICSSAKITSDLLDNLLQWAASNTGRISFNPETINIHEMFDEAITFFKPKMMLKEVDITNELAHERYVMADKHMLNTIIRNLLSNALKFSERQGNIEVIERPNEMDSITFGVRDHGVGMDQKIADQVTEIESRFSSAGTAAEQGTGLGLKLCKEFILRHNGDMWIESEMGQGTTVWFQFSTQPKTLQN